MARAALLLVSAAFLLSFFWMVSTSLKTIDKVMSDRPQLLPSPVAWENYRKVMTHPSMHFLRFVPTR